MTGAKRANIRACINGKIKTSGGRIWYYVKNQQILHNL
jgi:hypothetical protein